MKAIKTTLGKTGATLYLKALIIGTLSSAGITAILLMLISLMLKISGTLPYDLLVWITIAVSTVSTLIGGYITARVTKINGLLSGALCGIIMFTILMIAGLCLSEETLTYITLVKLIAFTISGGLGGIKGVNKKEKIRIK